ncbi:MAG: glycine cleavage system protein GcvH [Gammaproteobacteria bacterium]|nr:glycine cleavage system protein GcvH [Gammaproteobacteria bacterium]
MSKPNPTTNYRYTKDHEWAKDNADGTAMIGITDHAQEMLTDIVYVELPEMGRKIKQGERVAVVESVKSVSDVYAPVSGEVIAVNEDLLNHPEYVNQDAFEKGWIAKIKVSDSGEFSKLMDANAYNTLIKE